MQVSEKQGKRLRTIGLFLFLAATPAILLPTVVPLATVAAVAVGLCVVLLDVRAIQLARSPLTVPLLLLFLFAAVGTAVSAHPVWSFPKLLVIGWSSIAWRLMRSWGSQLPLWVSVFAYIAIAAGMATLGFLMADWQAKLFELSLPTLTDSLDSQSVSLNQIAGTLLFMLPLFYALTTTTRLWWVLAIPWTVVLITTQSRTAWIAIVGTLFILFFLSFWQKSAKKGRFLVAACFVGMMSIVIGGQLIDWHRLGYAWNMSPVDVPPGTLASLGMRREIWVWAIQAVGDYPLFGVGLGAFREVINQYPAILPPNFDIAHAHNIFVQSALDFGMLGLLAYIYIIGRISQLAWQTFQSAEQPFLRSLGLGLFAILIAIHLFGTVDAIALGSKPSLLFWLLLALIELCHQRATNSTSAPTLDLTAPSALIHQGK